MTSAKRRWVAPLPRLPVPGRDRQGFSFRALNTPSTLLLLLENQDGSRQPGLMPEYPGERTIVGLETVGVGGLFRDYFWLLAS